MSRERNYDVIRSPVITEKSTYGAMVNQFTFRVSRDATKPEIRRAVEELFKVKVTAVNTINQRGEHRRVRGRKARTKDYKKAIVTLAEGGMIDVTADL